MFGEVKGIIRINAAPFSRCVKMSAGKWGNYWRPVGSDKSEEKDSWIFQFITSAWGKGSLTLVDSKKASGLSHTDWVLLIRSFQARERGIFYKSWHSCNIFVACCGILGRWQSSPTDREDLIEVDAKYHRLCYMSYALYEQPKSVIVTHFLCYSMKYTNLLFRKRHYFHNVIL